MAQVVEKRDKDTALVELRTVTAVHPDGTVGLSGADFRLDAGERRPRQR